LVLQKPITITKLRDNLIKYIEASTANDEFIISFEELDKLTDKLPGVPTIENMIRFDQDNNKCHNYKTINGTVFGIPLLWSTEIAIQKIFMSANSEFDVHIHKDSTELVIVLKGELTITIGDEAHIVKKNEMFTVDKNVLHNATTIVDTWFIAVTIPADEFYPKP
jgi:quercetin dioxygenase-like cupin family protein